MSRQTIQKVYPLTPMQEGMLYHAMLDPESSSYFTQLELRITGKFDAAILERSISQLSRSYDILRTVFVHEKLQRPRQVVMAERRSELHYENIASMEPELQQMYLEDYKRDNQARGFHNLAKDQLFRVAVFQLAEGSYQFIWSNHHILLDGWSLGILMKKLFQYYGAFSTGLPLPAEPERPYADYIKWLEKQDKEEALGYWERRLAGFEQVTSLPEWRRPSAEEPYRNEHFTFVWDEELVASIKEAADRYQVTAPVLFQALWGALLGRYNNTGDVVFGTVVSGRPSAIHGIESMVGLFINTIPVRLRMENDTTFGELFAAVQQSALEAEKYDYVPLYEIQNRTALQHHLINHLLAFENYPLDRELEQGNLEDRLGFSVQVADALEQTNYDFNLIAFPGDRWTIKMMYNASVYDKQWIEKTAGHLTNMMRAAVADPAARISEACILTAEEQEEQLVTFNDTEAEYPRQKTIHQLFEQQAERVPDHVAVVYEKECITYRELNGRANRLSKDLRAKGVGRDVIVGIMADRSVEMIVGMVAILKAGGAYLPIDPAYPSDRIRFMLEDSGTKLLLTQCHLLGHAQFSGETMDLGEYESGGSEEDAVNPEPVNSPDDLCYVIYTSGTTGKPKGAMISHRNVVRLLVNDKLQFTFNDEDVWTMFHSFCFDFSVWEMYGALLYGGKLVVVPKLVAQSPSDFRELLIREKVTVLNQTPTAFSSLIQRELAHPDKRLGLRYVVFGGEALKPLILKDWHAKYPETKLINMYGITETTVHVTFKEIGEEEIRSNISNIGVPIPTLGCYIMDKHSNLVPVGVVGELCVTGLGVARGYLHRPELTAERFMDNPFKPGERLYRSGDLARFLPNGEMEYFGRIDHQVKIRGFRIELGEIEHQLLSMKPVTEAAVLARTDRHGDQTLCAYFVADRELTVKELREALLTELPDYMVPTHFIQLTEMPLTSNGKLDRKALPDPQVSAGGAPVQEPGNPLERRLTEIWADVLGTSRIGVDDDFFSLGGHSLKAMLLATKIHQQLEREVPIKVLFEQPTIRRLAQYLQEAQTEAEVVSSIAPAAVQPHYPVSSAQRRLYILHQLEGEGVSYNIPAALLLEGELDMHRLVSAFHALIERHETLRTSFDMVEGTIVQIIHERVPFDLHCSLAFEEDARTLVRSFIRPFHLNAAPLVRAELIQFGERRHLLLIDMHHIITDGASTAIFVRDLTQLYTGDRLPAPKLHYKDFAVWQNNPVMHQARLNKLEAYWLDAFAGDIPVLDLPPDYPRPSEPGFAGERLEFMIGERLAERIRRLTAETGTTLYMFLLAAFNVFLSKYSAQEEIIVGSPTAGRTHADITDVPGMFVNTIALRSAPEGGKTFKQFLLEVKETCLQAFAHQDYPFEELVEKLPLNRDTSRSPLFNVMFSLQNTDMSRLQLGGLNISPYPLLPVAAKFDLTLEAAERADGIILNFDYAKALFARETIRRWSEHLLQLAETAADHPDIRLSEMEMLSPAERRQLVDASGGPGVSGYTAYRTIQSRFADQAAKTPDCVAVADEERKLTYRELDETSDQLAKELRGRGVGRDNAVALLLDRSADTIVAIMAILKAGGAYLPIDPDNPEQRIQFMLQDSRARFVITKKEFEARISGASGIEIIDIRNDFRQAGGNAAELETINQGDDLAYIIYTSGTTGRPKGVMIEHRQVLHLVEGLRSQVYSHYDDTTLHVALVAPFHFDASVQQIFASLLLGHTLFIVPASSVFDGQALAGFYRSRRIDVTDGTPAHLQMLLLAKELQGVRLRHMLIGGEALPSESVRALLDLFSQSGTVPAITNVYGPTECCVDVSAFDIGPAAADDDRTSYVPIGRPLGNNRLYILDAYGKLQPAGVPGEICIAGDGVGRGYMNLPELTAEIVVPDPFFPGETMFRTGDLARKRTDGTIEFMGRIDHQVKIRGYRIEPGEIETALVKHERVEQAVVIANAHNHSSQELYAYFTANAELSAAELREWLSRQLPGYMIPSYFMQIETIPLTVSGKIDRRSLPAPDAARTAGTGFVPPFGETQKQLCLIWQDTLDVETIGIDDNFFELGGHSLKAITVVAAIQTKLQRNVSLKVLFDRPTVRQLAGYLEAAAADSSEYSGIRAAGKQDYYPVSSAQKRMYILQQMDDQGVSYNIPSALMMEGELDTAALERALQGLIGRHESLRTSFTEIEGVPVQQVHEHVSFHLTVTPGEGQSIEEQVRGFVRPFDLSSAPLIRAGVIRLSERRHLLLIDMHHIIADGVSAGILIRELAELYNGSELPAPRLQYKDFTLWQNEPAQQETIRKQERFWLDQFAGNVPVLQLPADYPRPAVQSFAGGQVRFGTTMETTAQIRALAAETGMTLHMIMLAALGVFLAKMSGEEEIVIGTAVAGRAHADLADIPGMFVNTLAIRSVPQASKTARQLLQEVKDACLQALEHQDYPFEELVSALNLPRELSRHPLFNVMLTLEQGEKRPFQLDRLSISPYEMTHGISKFDLTLGVFEGEGEIALQFDYCSDLFTKETIVRWSGYLLNVIRHMAAGPDCRLSELELMAPEEKRRMLEDWNRTEMVVPANKTVHELFEAQVRRTPDRSAVAYNGRQWTYRELNARANHLARLLTERGIGTDQRIGIIARPSLEMAAGVLAILKAGGAFVPIDPDYPEERIAYILSDSGAPIVLAQPGLPVPAAFGGDIIRLEGDNPYWADDAGLYEEANPRTAAGPQQLAYVIYTSGTTGRPKGVMIEHRSLVNLCYWHNEAFAVSGEDRSAKYAGFGFDASVWEMFPYWIAGAEVHIIDEAIRMDIVRLNEYFERNRITVAFLPTQICEQFMEMDNRSLRILLTGGDKLKRAAAGCKYTLVNNYGPTESTVVATSTPIRPGEGTLSIGRPIANTRVYILGPDNQPQPVGAAGELCIAGRGIARGYINRPKETAERFVADPFAHGERMYRTGDSARWLENGSIEYMGRIDRQVKVRGFRIELSEIEAQLAQHPSVKTAVVADVRDAVGNTALCAYVVAEGTLDTAGLQKKLARMLPDYMVPQYWVPLETLPLTPNGKVDTKALPQPDTAAAASDYKAPETETEALLAELWQDVLGVRQVGTRDSFFSLGGDSIKAIQMASRLYKHGWKLEMKDLFRHPTIEQVRPYLQRAAGQPADQGAAEGEVKLTPVQRWFFERGFTGMHHWNQSVMLHAPSGFDPHAVRETLRKITEHHDALRMIYTVNEDGVLQYNRGAGHDEASLEVIDLRGVSDIGSSIAAHANRLQGSIDLGRGPLMKSTIFLTGDGDHLLVVIHHLVVDGVSWRILLEDFASGYHQAVKGQPIVLQEKTNSYQHWAEKLADYANTALFLKQAEYWRKLESERTMPLPKDNRITSSKEKDSAAVSFELTEEETRLLLTQVHRPYATEMNDILLCALGLAVREWTEEPKVCIELEGHGREEIIQGMNVTRTVGWFTAQYPVVLEIDGAMDLPALIKATKENLRSIPDKGIGYGMLRYLTAAESKSGLDFQLKPEISFNYLGQFDSEVQTEWFGPSPYDMGHQIGPEAESTHALNFTGIVRSGRLLVTCSFNKQQYLRGTITGGMGRFKHHLLQIISHCTAKEDREFTPSDFSAGNLQMDEMEDIFDMLAEKLG